MNKALLIAIDDYNNHNVKLNGCYNGVKKYEQFLRLNKGFTSFNIKGLVNSQATKENILQGLKRLTDNIQPGDNVFVMFSCHGSLKYIGNEVHECIVSYNSVSPQGIDQDNFITDTELNSYFKNIPVGVNFIIVIDACHSADMQKDISENKFIINPNVNTHGNFAKELVNNAYSFKDLLEPNIILLSACGSQQTAAEFFIDNEYRGAFEYYLLKTLYSPGVGNGTLKDIIGNVNYELNHNEFSQIAEICGNPKLFNNTFF